MTVHEMVSVPVHPALSGLVDAIVGYRIEDAAPGVHVGMPSRSLTVILPIGQLIEVSWPQSPAPAVAAYTGIVGGFHTRPAHVHHDGWHCGIQLGLTPAGARALLGVRAADLPSEGLITLDEAFGVGVDALHDRVGETQDTRVGLGLLQEWLARRAGMARQTMQPEVAEVWRLLCRTHGRIAVSRAAELVGWSPRYLTERFRTELGMGPKLAARVMRFERSHRMIQAGLALATVADRCGYADQSHLTREWQQFAGSGPARWMRIDEFAFVQDDHQAMPPS